MREIVYPMICLTQGIRNKPQRSSEIYRISDDQKKEDKRMSSEELEQLKNEIINGTHQ